MSKFEERRGPAHMAGRSGKASNSSRRRREPLRDNYYYEEPRRGSRRDDFEDVESYSSSGKKRADQREFKRQKKKGSTAKKVFIILAVFILLVTGAVYWYVNFYLLRDLTVRGLTKTKEELVNPGKEEIQVQMDDSIKNIALLGTDSRSNDNHDQVRTDIVMVLTVDNKHKKIKMTSILRDSNVSIPLEDSNGDIYYSPDKITHAYFWGGAEAGPETAIRTINRNFYLDIDDYVLVNFYDMARIVNAFNGVDIELSGGEVQQLNQNLWDLSQEVLDQKETDRYNGVTGREYAVIQNEDIIPNIYGNRSLYSADYEYEEKTYHLNGNQAVAYARIRHLEGGDDVRASRQQTVLKALIEQIRGKSKTEYPELIRQVMPMCETSLSFTDIVAMLPIMFTDFTIETLTVPGEEEEAFGTFNVTDGWSRWVYSYDLEEAARHINKFIYEDNAQPDKIGGRDDVYGVSHLTYGSYSNNSGSGSADDPDLDALPPVSSVEPPDDDTSSDTGGENWGDTSSSGGDNGNTSSTGGEDGTSSSGGGGEDNPDGGGGENIPPDLPPDNGDNGGGGEDNPDGGGGENIPPDLPPDNGDNGGGEDTGMIEGTVTDGT